MYGHGLARGRPGQLPGMFVYAGLGEGRRDPRDDPRILECKPCHNPDQTGCLNLVFLPCILGCRVLTK